MGDAADDLTMRWASTGEDTGFAPRARSQSTTANLGQITKDGFAYAWDDRKRVTHIEAQLAERQHTIEKAHRLVTQWLARPEPPNTGELIELATILEGSKQPEGGWEVK